MNSEISTNGEVLFPEVHQEPKSVPANLTDEEVARFHDALTLASEGRYADARRLIEKISKPNMRRIAEIQVQRARKLRHLMRKDKYEKVQWLIESCVLIGPLEEYAQSFVKPDNQEINKGGRPKKNFVATRNHLP